MEPKVSENAHIPRSIVDKLKLKFESEVREGVHVSDLIFPKKAWLAKRFPRPITDDEALYFIAGRAHHALVEELIGEGTLTEHQVVWRDIHGTIDVVMSPPASVSGTDQNGSPAILARVPAEFKTTRAARPYAVGDIPPHYLRQLGMYVAMMRGEDDTKGLGLLVVLYLSTRSTSPKGGWRSIPSLRAYDVDYPDLNAVRGDMLMRKTMVTGPVVPPTSLCPPWLCKTCPYFEAECEGREEYK